MFPLCSVKPQFPQPLLALAHQANSLGEGPVALLSWPLPLPADGQGESRCVRRTHHL